MIYLNRRNRRTGKHTLLMQIAISLLSTTTASAAEQLEAGQEIPVVLMTKISSWPETPAGTPIRLIVAQDISSKNGKVLIKAGSQVKGKVTWARATPAVSAYGSRLHITIDSTTAIDNQTVLLSCVLPETPPNLLCHDHEKDGGGKRLPGVFPCYKFTREETGHFSAASQALKSFAKNPGAKQFLQELSKAVETGNVDAIANDPQKVAIFTKLVQDANLSSAQETITNGDVKGLFDSVKSLITGPINFTNGPTYVQGAIEVVGLVGKMRNASIGIFEGRNLTALRGMPLTAFVSQNQDITPAAQ